MLIALMSALTAILDSIGFISLAPFFQSTFNLNFGSVDVVTTSNETGVYAWISSYFSELDVYTSMSLIMLSFIGKGFVMYIASYISADAKAKIHKEIRTSLLKSFTNQSYGDFLKLNSGYFINIINDQMSRALLAVNAYVLFLSALIFAIVYGFFVADMIWGEALLYLSIGALLIGVFFRLLNRFVRRLSRDVKDLSENLTNNIVQVLANFKYLRATGRFKTFVKVGEELIEDVVARQKRLQIASGLTKALREPLVVLFLLFIIFYLGSALGANANMVLVLLIVLYRLFNSVFQLQASWQAAMENIAGLEALDDVLRDRALVEEAKENKAVSNMSEKTKISFKNVSFRFSKKDGLIFDNVSFDIKENGIYIIKGYSGRGKTTLVDLVSGLLEPSSGIIKTSIKAKKIGFVVQNPPIFSTTVAKNISMDFDEIDNLERIIEVCKLTNIHKDILTLPKEYNTIVGVGGVILSGGQSQRISIARELYQGPDLLILDEPTSALDDLNRDLMIEGLQKVAKKSIVIMITHDSALYKYADRIFKVENKQLVREN